MTLDQLITISRSRADEQSTGFISNTEVTDYLNHGLTNFYGDIVARYEDYYIAEGTVLNGGLFSTVSATQGYTLPTTMIKLVRAETRSAAATNDNEWKKLERLNIANDRIDSFYPVREGYGQIGVGYFIAGSKLYLKPVPTSPFSVRLWFIPRVTELVSGSDEPGIPSEYHRLLAEFAAIQMLAKSGEGIWKERSDLFQIQYKNLLETIEFRDQTSEQMVISDDSDFDRNW